MARKIQYSNKWEKDLKNLSNNKQYRTHKKELADCINNIANGIHLDPRYDNHKMKNWTLDYKDMYNFHLASNICVIYDLREDGVIKMVRIGPHPYLGLTEQLN